MHASEIIVSFKDGIEIQRKWVVTNVAVKHLASLMLKPDLNFKTSTFRLFVAITSQSKRPHLKTETDRIQSKHIFALSQ